MSPQCQPRIGIARAGLAALAMLALSATGREYSLELGFGRPEQSGYLQTPAGGMPGTASSKRPTLAEIDLDGGGYRWLGARVDFGPNARIHRAAPFHLRLYARHTTIGDDATSMITDAFTIRGGVFEAGDSVRCEVAFDSLTLALTAAFDLRAGLSVELGPEIVWTAFDFGMTGERHRSDRAYHVTTFGLVGEISKELGNGWHIGARFAASPAIEGTGSRYAAETRAGLDLSKNLRVAVGASIEAFRYDDAHKQVLPNRLNVTRRIVPTASVRLRL
ncbi:MAG: hypothetical protein OXI79_20005 [Gammaproteobacteria bacterium]|nr:hypothetical protein [Gammaproteobacteria bacterium]